MVAEFDLVVRHGMIVDGSGGAPREGDVAVRDGRIAAIGKVSGSGREEIEARDHLVTPGFIDVHTHYDGQATWENRMAPSSNHGVTTVVMGNCGVGFAPCRSDDHDKLVKLMEGVEDVPEIVMTTGLPWNWETFPEYLDALAARKFDVDVAAQVPHSPLRVYVMGERGANREPATAADLARMTTIVRDAVHAGAVGVSTSRLMSHRSADGTPIPSFGTAKAELLALGEGLRQAGRGVFQMIPDYNESIEEEFELMRAVAEVSGRPLSFTLGQSPTEPNGWRDFLKRLEDANAAGLTMRGQVFPRPIGMLFGLDLSFNPVSRRPSWRTIAGKPLAERVKALRDPEFRARILAETDEPSPLPMMNMLLDRTGAMVPIGNPPNYLPSKDRSIAALAQREGKSMYECAIDQMLADDGRAVLYIAAGNYADGNLDAVRTLIHHDNTVLGLGDGGAHYGLVCDASYPSTMLSYWCRDAAPADRIPIEKAIKELALIPAQAMGMSDRGQLAVGKIADINVIDQGRVSLQSPRVVFNLPGNGRRLTQGATGYTATIKTGVVSYRDGVETGALPGRLVRSQDDSARMAAE